MAAARQRMGRKKKGKRGKITRHDQGREGKEREVEMSRMWKGIPRKTGKKTEGKKEREGK